MAGAGDSPFPLMGGACILTVPDGATIYLTIEGGGALSKGGAPAAVGGAQRRKGGRYLRAREVLLHELLC